MIVKEELLDYSRKPAAGHEYVFTGNAYVRADGALVMGRGAAKQVRDLYYRVQYELGEKVNIDSRYHLLRSESAGFPIWVFQVKTHFKSNADIGLIKESTVVLKFVATTYPETTFHMNFPGIGNGKLANKEDDIYQILLQLPDNVIVYRGP